MVTSKHQWCGACVENFMYGLNNTGVRHSTRKVTSVVDAAAHGQAELTVVVG